MKKIISFFLVLAMTFSLCACGGNTNQTESKDTYIGVWENINPTKSDSGRYLHQLKVYKGGTGDRVIIDEDRSEPIILSFSWEINDDVFNMITSDFGGETKSGYILKDGKLISVDGKSEFKKMMSN